MNEGFRGVLLRFYQGSIKDLPRYYQGSIRELYGDHQGCSMELPLKLGGRWDLLPIMPVEDCLKSISHLPQYNMITDGNKIAYYELI